METHEEPLPDAGGLISALFGRWEECDDCFIRALHLYAAGKTEEQAKKELALLEEVVATAAEDEAQCERKKCDRGKKCVFDWATIGEPICHQLPEVTTRKLKMKVAGHWVCRRTSVYGCFCDGDT